MPPLAIIGALTDRISMRKNCGLVEFNDFMVGDLPEIVSGCLYGKNLSVSSIQGRLKLNGSDNVPLGVLACRITVCPLAILLPAFFPIRIMVGF